MNLTKPVRDFQLPLALREVPKPWNYNEPVDLEIGCGVGYHPIQRVKAFPNRVLIAIEHTKNRYDRFARRIENHPPFENLVPVHANAISWISNHVPRRTLSEIFLLYPNPNPKNPANRWFAMPFLARLLESLKEGGLIHLATNEEFYWREAKRLAQGTWGLSLQQETLFTKMNMTSPRTHFEKKYLERGQTCYDLCFRLEREGAR